jgi:hypothetical protein
VKFKTLFDILAATPGDADACALAVVKASNGSTPRELLDAFSIALGAGKLNPPFASALLVSLERFRLDAELSASINAEDPILSGLRQEVEELTARREELSRRDSALAELRERAQKLNSAFEEAQARRDMLTVAVASLREQCDRAESLAAGEAT